MQTPRFSLNSEKSPLHEQIEMAVMFYNGVLITTVKQRLAQLRNGSELESIIGDVKILCLNDDDDGEQQQQQQQLDYQTVSLQATKLTRKICDVYDIVNSELKAERVDLIEQLETDKVNAVRTRAAEFNLKRRDMLDRSDALRVKLVEDARLRELATLVLDRGVENDRTLLLRIATHANALNLSTERIELHQRELNEIERKIDDLDDNYLNDSTANTAAHDEKKKKITRENKRARKYFSQLCHQIIDHLKEIVALASQDVE